MTDAYALPDLDALEVLPERHDSHLEFNVMPGRPVIEDLRVHQYRRGHRYAEAHFHREYRSAMKASPSHLIFLSALVHTQKLLYVALCREFGFEYDPGGAEKLKMWPTKVECRIPELIDQERDLVQQLWVREVKKFNDRTYRVRIETRIDSLVITAVVPTFLLEDPR